MEQRAWPILPCWFGRVLIVRGLLVTDKLLDVGSVTAPDAVSKIVEEFEDGACLLGCPFGIDDELDSTPETGRLMRISGHAKGLLVVTMVERFSYRRLMRSNSRSA